jgi:hypothetical protein
MGIAVWTDRKGLGRQIHGTPAGDTTAMYSGSRDWKNFADGGWEAYYNYTWGDAPQRGDRVYGWGALRFLCAINGIDPPRRRLKGEPFYPDTRLLVATVWDQLDRYRNEVTAYRGVGYINAEGDPIEIADLTGPPRAFWERLERAHIAHGLR